MAQKTLVPDPARLPVWRIVLIFVVSLALIGTLIFELVTPVRAELANRHLARGDSYFASLQFDLAEQEYQTALSYQSKLSQAQSRLALVKVAPTDIAAARSFYAEKGVKKIVEQIDAATRPFTDPKEALAAGAALYNQSQFPYAQYPLQSAVKLDPAYPEAWHYLYLTYTELAKLNASYRDKAEEAKQRRDALTPRYLKEETPGVK